MKFKPMVLAVLASTVSTLATAELSTADLSVRADRRLVVDSQTNLAWLNLSLTAGLSLDQVAVAGWFDQGFSLATQAQVDTLMTSVTFTRHLFMLGGGPVSRIVDGVTWWTSPSLTGAMAADFSLAQSSGMVVKTFEFGPMLTPPQGSGSTPGDRGWYIELPTDEPVVTEPGGGSLGYELISSATATWFGTQNSLPGAGVFLVRSLSAVPEPATWMLMGVGLVGLSLSRRARRRAGRQPS